MVTQKLLKQASAICKLYKGFFEPFDLINYAWIIYGNKLFKMKSWKSYCVLLDQARQHYKFRRCELAESCKLIQIEELHEEDYRKLSYEDVYEVTISAKELIDKSKRLKQLKTTKKLVTMHYVNGLTSDEISKQLGMKLPMVWYHLKMGKNILLSENRKTPSHSDLVL